MSEWLLLCVIISLMLSLVTITGFIVYSGLISEINIRTGCPPIKNITFAYKFKKGPYKKCGQLFTESCSIGPKLPCIGVFYDDPKKVPGQQCRCAVGSILSEGDDKPSEELLHLYEKSGFHVFSFPEVTHVVTTSFPHRTVLSVLLGVKRVYPRLEHYIKGRKLCAHPFLEIYQEGRIQYMAPLARQGDFYVPEVRPAERRLSTGGESDSDAEISGADSNSSGEYSSGSGILLSDSRETSRAPSSVHSLLCHDQEGGWDVVEKSSTMSSFQELDPELPGSGQQTKGAQQACGSSNKEEDLEVTAREEQGVVVRGEE